MEERELELSLEALTEGGAAADFSAYSAGVFTQKSSVSGLQRFHVKSRKWVYGSGVHGMGVGERSTKGHLTGDLALLVYVKKKKPNSKIKNKIPSRVNIPELGKVDIDVVEIGNLRPQIFTQKVRPAMPGCGIGHAGWPGVGTLGLVVKSKNHTGTFVLSNSHVLAKSGTANKGDAIIQRGYMDGGRKSTEKIGELATWIPYVYSRYGFPNLVDAAIAKVHGNSANNNLRELNIQPTGLTDVINRYDEVRKVGRTTDVTTSVVRDIHAKISYPMITNQGGRSRVGWCRQVRCDQFTDDGDSGAAVLNTQDRVVGLHFLGGDGASFFNRIRNVFELFDLETELPD